MKKFNNKIPIGLQISHSGRKGSAKIPWEKSNTPLKKRNGGWVTYAPSAIRRDKKWPVPKELSIKTIALDYNPNAIGFKESFDYIVVQIKESEQCIDALYKKNLNSSKYIKFSESYHFLFLVE